MYVSAVPVFPTQPLAQSCTAYDLGRGAWSTVCVTCALVSSASNPAASFCLLCWCLQVMTAVQTLARTGVTCVATIHSPTAYCFSLFDR